MDYTNYGDEFFNVTGKQRISASVKESLKTSISAPPRPMAPSPAPKPVPKPSAVAQGVIETLKTAPTFKPRPASTHQIQSDAEAKPRPVLTQNVVNEIKESTSLPKPFPTRPSRESEPLIPPTPQVTTPVVLPSKIVAPEPPKPSENIPVKEVEPKKDKAVADSKPQLPTFPNFANLDCLQLNSQISAIQSTLMTSRFSNREVRQAYENALLSAKTEYSKKNCDVKSKPTEPEKLTEGTPAEEKPKEEEKAPAPMGGGGGGGAAPEEAPAEEAAAQTPAEQPQPKKINWLPILLIAGVALYLLTRKD